MMTKRQLAYLCVTLFGAFLLNVAATLGYVQHVEHERVKAERAAQLERERQAEGTRRIVCDLANGYLRVYNANPPASEAQRGVQATWQAMADRFTCPPPA